MFNSSGIRVRLGAGAVAATVAAGTRKTRQEQCATHAGRVKRHQHGAMEQITGGVNEPDRFLLGEDDGQTAGRFRIGYFLHRVVSLQRLAEEEAQCCRVIADRPASFFEDGSQDLLVTHTLPPQKTTGVPDA